MSTTLDTVDGRPALRLERRLAHSVQRAWRAVSVPDELRQWMPAAVDWTPSAGEALEAGGMTGAVTEVDAPHLLAWTFAGDRFRFELRPDGDGCLLAFTHVFGDRASAAQTAAGWDCYFDRLDAHLLGGVLSEERAHQPIGERHERYAADFGLDPAPGRAFVAALDFRYPVLDTGPTLVLERHYDQPIERMWQALTDADELRDWFPGPLEVSESVPPRLLVATWQGAGTLRVELRPEGAGCALTFTHGFTDREKAALAAAGWDRCFARLDGLLAGRPIGEADSLTHWPDVHERLAAAWGIDPEIGRRAYSQRG